MEQDRARGEPLPHLRDWRNRAGLTQEQLAERAGVARDVVRRAEAGGTVRGAAVAKLARGLGITVHDLRTVDPSTLPPA